MTKKERQELVAAIEAGRYKAKRNANDTAIIVIAAVMAAIIVLPMFVIAAVAGAGAAFIMLIMTGLMFLPFVVVFIVINANKGADLGKLTPQARQLILDGKIIEARLDAIEQKSNLYTFRCSADYAGYTYYFVSPSISVEPIPSGERTVPVFIDPQNPNLYVVNIYSRLPIANNGVLEDRSELQVSTKKIDPNQSSRIAIIVIACIFLLPVGLSSAVIGLSMIIEGNPVAALTGTLPIAMAVFMVFLITKSVKKNENVAKMSCYVPATAQRFWVTHSKNSTTYHLSARYIEPSTKIVHDFQTSGPSSMKNLVGTKINTYINPDNTNEYYMDVKSALKNLGFTVSNK